MRLQLAESNQVDSFRRLTEERKKEAEKRLMQQIPRLGLGRLGHDLETSLAERPALPTGFAHLSPRLHLHECICDPDCTIARDFFVALPLTHVTRIKRKRCCSAPAQRVFFRPLCVSDLSLTRALIVVAGRMQPALLCAADVPSMRDWPRN